MLYGSRARGDGGEHSDVDLLQVTIRESFSHHKGRYSVVAYPFDRLFSLARAGSLYVLHLKLEGRVLEDAYGDLARVLDAYAPPVSYDPLNEGLRAAASMLDVPCDWSGNRTGLFRAGVFILRTALYARCAAAGRPTFAMAEVARHVGDPRVESVSALKHRTEIGPDEIALIRGLVERYLGLEVRNPYGTLEALAVSLYRRHPLAASLAVRVLAGDQELDYVRMPDQWVAP